MINQINQIIEISRLHHNHFFDADAMRFFNSRISTKVYESKTKGVYYFVTSEKYKEEPRRYTVRKFVEETGSIDTLDINGEDGFQYFASLREAHRFLKQS